MQMPAATRGGWRAATRIEIERIGMGKTFGLMAVDWEQRTDMDRLRRERLARAQALLADSELGALLCFDMNNVRHITATHIGTWAMDKLARFCLLPQGGDPTVWDFGSAARHHDLYCPWLNGRSPSHRNAARDAHGALVDATHLAPFAPATDDRG